MRINKKSIKLGGKRGLQHVGVIIYTPRKITGASWNMSNNQLHRDLKRLHPHSNPLIVQLLEEPQLRRLKRKFPFDL